MPANHRLEKVKSLIHKELCEYFLNLDTEQKFFVFDVILNPDLKTATIIVTTEVEVIQKERTEQKLNNILKVFSNIFFTKANLKHKIVFTPILSDASDINKLPNIYENI